MSIKPNCAGNMLAILPLMCAVSFAAFGADELQSQARQGRNQDPLFLTATNGANNSAGGSQYPDETNQLCSNRRRRHADDLLQETWLRIHEVRHTYLPGRPLLPWLYAIARNVRVDHYRKAHRAAGREEQLEENREFPAAATDHVAATADLEALLAGLPESQREVIAMLKVNGMSLEEVAMSPLRQWGASSRRRIAPTIDCGKGWPLTGLSNVRGRGAS